MGKSEQKSRQRCYLYTRVSTQMQFEGYSLDAQHDRMAKYAEYVGIYA